MRLDAEAIARGILEREAGKTIRTSVADPSIFSQDGGPSVGERMRRAGVGFGPADNTRVGKAGALSGWDQVRARIAGTQDGPMLAVFDTCRDFIRTVPVLQHDRMRLEDLRHCGGGPHRRRDPLCVPRPPLPAEDPAAAGEGGRPVAAGVAEGCTGRRIGRFYRECPGSAVAGSWQWKVW